MKKPIKKVVKKKVARPKAKPKATKQPRFTTKAPVPNLFRVEADEVWVAKDGRRFRVWEMEESHVRNALRMVIRKARQAELNARRRHQEAISQLFDFPDAPFDVGDFGDGR